MVDTYNRRFERTTSSLIRLACFLAMVVAALMPLPVAGQELQVREVEIAPEPAHQTALADLAKVTDKEAYDRQMDRLLKDHSADRTQLIEQLLYFSARHDNDTKSRTILADVLKQLDTQNETIVRAIAPQLDNRDANVRSLARDLLSGYEDRSVTRPPDFTPYRAIIEADIRAGRPLQESLVRFMYESDPGVALLTMIRGVGLRKPDEIKPILWGEHIVAELFWKRQYGFIERDGVEAPVLEQIDKLSRHERWWARLYVAHIINAHPELGQPAVINRLAADSNNLVNETIQAAIAKLKKP